MRTQMPSTGIAALADPAEDLVGLGAALPFLAALPVAQVLVDPGDQAACERRAEMRLSESRGERSSSVTTRSMSRIALAGSRSNDPAAACTRTHLLDEFAHVLRAGAGRRLVGHRT